MQTLEQFLNATLSEKSAERYLAEINNFIETNPRSKSYKYIDIIKYMEVLSNIYPNEGTRSRVFSSIKRYYDYLYFSGKRKDHPCKRLNIKTKKTKIQTQDLFTIDELLSLFNRPNRYKYLDIRNNVVLSLLIYQGLTSQEITNINLSNVDLESGNIYLKASRKISSRTLSLNEFQLNVFKEYIMEVRPKLRKIETSKLLLSKMGEPLKVDGIFSIVEPMKMYFSDRILNPEKIRMSVISYWLNEKKYSIETVLDLSGIKWSSSVLMYKRIDIKALNELINKYHPLR